jgi:hypothetical protein
MGKASSAKKIKKVQQAGVSRAPGQRRNLGYPAMIGVIIIVGLGLTFLARQEREVSASEAPVVNRDHWHAAFGIDVCGDWEPALADDGPDTMGIHTHADGLIHIHPFVGAASGDRAVFQLFANQVGLELGENSFTLPDGRTFTDGDDCEGDDGETTPGRVALYVWPPQATEATDPEIVTDAIGETRFRRDGQIFVLAFVPEDAEVGLPPSLAELASPSDLEVPPEQGSVEYTIPRGAEPDEGEVPDEAPAPPDAAEGEGDAPAAEAGGDAPAETDEADG